MPLSPNRRDFLKVAGVGAIASLSPLTYSRVLGANDRVRVAVAGLNGRGKSHVDEYSRMKDVEIAYLIDPDTRTYAAQLKKLEKGTPPKTVQDVRKALDDTSLNAISIATPNHWHALMTIWGCQAGKDVYVEKPCSHNIHEGRIAVETARKHNRIVQHGTQRRASGGWSRIAGLVKSGKYGKLLVSRGLVYKRRKSIDVKPLSSPPAEVDFNIWTGPAAETPFHGNLVHYNWHWFWNFGNGDIGNQGVHQMDVARWMIPGATLPKSVISMGGRFGYKDQGETPNTQITLFDFGDTHLIFEVRGLETPKYPHCNDGSDNTLHFEAGTIAGGKFYPKGSDKGEALVDAKPKGSKGDAKKDDAGDVDNIPGSKPGGGIFGNFIAAVKSRKVEDQYADILEGHYSSALCHLANMSYRLGREVPFSVGGQALDGDADATEALSKTVEHLGTNGVKVSDTMLRVGRKLSVDTKTESIVGDDQANAMRTRAYRAPFSVPDKV